MNLQKNGLDELFQHRVVSDERQSRWLIRRTFTWAGHKLRVTIHHDPYMFQADYCLELFNPRDLKWNRVHTEPSEAWYNAIDCLNTGKMTAEQWDQVDALVNRMVAIGQDLLEGVDA